MLEVEDVLNAVYQFKLMTDYSFDTGIWLASSRCSATDGASLGPSPGVKTTRVRPDWGAQYAMTRISHSRVLNVL